jgi:hypothetical protein
VGSHERLPAPHVRDLVKEIGELTVVPAEGTINVIPRRDADPGDVRLLLACAELAFREKPSRASGCVDRRRKGRSWWRCTILRAVREGEAAAGAFRSAQKVVDLQRSALDANATYS